MKFDRDEKSVRETVRKYFENDTLKFVRAYYELISWLPKHGKFDTIGHFDLITKHCEAPNFLDISSEKYLNCA